MRSIFRESRERQAELPRRERARGAFGIVAPASCRRLLSGPLSPLRVTAMIGAPLRCVESELERRDMLNIRVC